MGVAATALIAVASTVAAAEPPQHAMKLHRDAMVMRQQVGREVEAKELFRAAAAGFASRGISTIGTSTRAPPTRTSDPASTAC